MFWSFPQQKLEQVKKIEIMNSQVQMCSQSEKNIPQFEESSFLQKIINECTFKCCNLMSIMIYQNQNLWTWQQCNLIIKRKHSDSQFLSYFQSLCPEISFILGESQQYLFKATISMNQRLLYDPNLGFYWHKSHYLPKINIEIEEFERNLIINANQSQNYEVEILAGYPVRQNETYFLQQVELIGTRKYKMRNQAMQVTIQNVKFNETSFFHNKNKFCLIIAFSISQTSSNTKEILISYISSPISIDSRKNASVKKPKGEYISQRITLQEFEKPILCNILSPFSEMKCLPESNFMYGSFEHFINYYSLSKIRGKLRHPFYIGYHFDSTFLIFYNQEICSNCTDALNMIEKHHKQLNQKILLFYVRNLSHNQETNKNCEKKFLLNGNDVKQQQQEMQYNQQHLLGSLTKQNKKKQEFLIVQNLKKKLLRNLFISWEYSFVEIQTEDEMSVEKLHKKWVHVQKQKLRENYFKYLTILEDSQIKLEEDEMEQRPKIDPQVFHSQVITLSKSSRQIDEIKEER